jgi:hypothetical protein
LIDSLFVIFFYPLHTNITIVKGKRKWVFKINITKLQGVVVLEHTPLHIVVVLSGGMG